MTTLTVLMTISGILTTDLVRASPVALPTNTSGDYTSTPNHIQLGIRKVAKESSLTQGLVPNLTVTPNVSTTEEHVMGPQFVVDTNKTKEPVVAYPGIDLIRGSNTSSPVFSISNTAEISSNPEAVDNIWASQTGHDSHYDTADNRTMSTKRDNIWAQLTGWNVEDPIEDVIRPKPNKPTCFYRDTPAILYGTYREYYIAANMPANEIPSLCGGLWDNLHGNGCTVFINRPECKAWKGKHYDGLRWYFSTYDSCRLNVPPKVYYKATYGKMGGIKECIEAPPRADEAAEYPHDLGSDE